MKFTEKCSCGAALKVALPHDIKGYSDWYRMLEDTAAKWRTSHVHEMPEAEMEAPTISESGSSHERALNEYGVSDRAPMGFRRND